VEGGDLKMETMKIKEKQQMKVVSEVRRARSSIDLETRQTIKRLVQSKK
jgi:hypothetical protein